MREAEDGIFPKRRREAFRALFSSRLARYPDAKTGCGTSPRKKGNTNVSRIKNLKQAMIMPETQSWFGNCHSSTLVKTGPNDFLCAYMAGEREGMPDMSIWLSRCENGTWREPVRIKSIYRFPHWNPVLHFDGGRVYLIYKVGPSVPLWYTMISTSDDLGATWTESREAVPGDYTPRITARNKVLVGSDGSWFGPCSIEGEEYWDCYIDVSRDSGKTWKKHDVPLDHSGGRLQSGGEWAGLEEGALWENDLSTVLKWDGIIQPTLWESAPGNLHALMRSTRGRVYRTDSSDNGESWGEAYPVDLPNNNSGIDLARLPDGTLVLAYNPVSGNWTLRTPISVVLSSDNGKTFGDRIDLETREGEFSYPAVIADGNTVHMTYTFKRKSIVYATFDVE